MITRVFFAPRRQDLSTEECLAHWRGKHAEIGAALPGVRSYVQNHGVLRDGWFLLPYPGFDIMPELQWEGVHEMDAAIDSPAHEEDSIGDEANFIDTSRTGYAVTTRHRVGDGRVGPESVKLITILRRGVTTDGDAFAAALLGPYAKAVEQSGERRHEILVSLPDRAGRPPFAAHAVDIIWFDTPEDALAWTTSADAHRAAWHLSGMATGGERLIARPHRIV